ncbi:arginine-glutamic acid dipeptide repeats protein-like [Rhipicephalus sanguineus]|uniref:arginine-glutamic acid dipeptide repeats protein-like n=1 Tax=Rhipicephalus sanguineus TaxID=34632 RepID=UPI001892E9E6|nr:arginine-glutamic acid dipeptide repeats protein-like [Rhipicephalus sanguineus]
MLPNKTRRRSKSGRRRGSKKDDPFGATAPDDAEGVSPTLREKDMESAITMDLGAGVPYQGAPIGKQQPPPPTQPAPDQPASIMAPKKERKRHRRRRKHSTLQVDEGTETTAAPIPPEALSSGTAAGTSGTTAVPKRKGTTASGKVPPQMAVVTSGPLLQGAAADAGYLLGGTQQAAPAPPPPVMVAPLGSSTAAPTAPYPPERLPGMPVTAAQQELYSGQVADFGKATPSGSEQQATTTRTATVAALVPPLVPPAQDIPQKIDEACAALSELAMQQCELPSADPSTSTAGGTHHTAARPNGAIRQRSPSLARMAAKYPQVSQQTGGSIGAGGQRLSGQPSAMRPIYSIDAAYAQQPNRAPNYSQASQNAMPTSIGDASATRTYFQPPQTPQPARNVGPQTAIAAVTNTSAVPSQRNMMPEAMDTSSTRHGRSAFSSAVKSTQQAGEHFHAGTSVETEAVRTAPPPSRPSTSREERPIPAKKVIAWTMNKTAATRACHPRSVPTSSRPSEQPVPSTSSRNVSETTISCCHKCHSCASENRSYPDDLCGASLEQILRHDDDIRWDEQLRERSRQLREERIRQEERLEQRQRMQDQERLLREERQFLADLERRREADKALQRALERESEAEARATAAVLQILASTQDQEIARSSAGASQDNQTAAEQEDALSSSEDDAVIGSQVITRLVV